MKDKEFNLLREPWIKVMTSEGAVKECSLVDALICSHEYRMLAGELPTQDIAILRLLLAVLQTVVYRVEENGKPALIENRRDAFRRWQAIWNEGKLPQNVIKEYLYKWEERFYLFHPERPFYQVVEASIGTECKASKLNGEISESNNKARLFSSRSGETKESLTYAQAARWLIYVNAYDDTSSKPKQKGRPSCGAGWLGKLGLIYADGDNLFETLMLNLVLVYKNSKCWNKPKPIWEFEKARSSEREQIAMPDNQAELLTLQSRRLLLDRNKDMVTGYKVLGGDFFEKEDAWEEQMTIWRVDDSKKSKAVHINPKRHNPDRQLWREFGNILADEANGERPGVVSWIALLKKSKLINKYKVICFKIASVKYGDKDFFATDVYGDYIEFKTGLLDDVDNHCIQLIKKEIRICDNTASVLGRLADNISKASGNKADSRSKYAKEEFYYEIDIPFRKWLLRISPDSIDSFEELIKNWRKEEYDIVNKIAKNLVKEAGALAFVGRQIEENKERNLYTSPKAYNNFIYEVRQCLEIN